MQTCAFPTLDLSDLVHSFVFRIYAGLVTYPRHPHTKNAPNSGSVPPIPIPTIFHRYLWVGLSLFPGKGPLGHPKIFINLVRTLTPFALNPIFKVLTLLFLSSFRLFLIVLCTI